MSPATAFQYTPPSYLVRASDSTNRPWNKTEEGEGGHDNQFVGENEYDLPQEDRPQTRRETHLDAHFQQRVRNKQSRYSQILSGEADIVDESNASESYAGDDEDDSVIAAAKNADSFADIHSAKLNVQSASSNQHARKIRKERMTGMTEPRSSSAASDAENARSLRAHRLRNSLLKLTPDEYEVQDKLEARRRARQEEEAADRRAEREAKMNDPTFQSDSISNRKDIEAKRKALEAKREAMALAKEHAAVALLRAAELNEERIRQRDRDQLLEQYRQEEERIGARRDKGSKKNRHMRAKSYNSDGDTWMTEFDAENDFAFLNDLSGMIRESGIVKSCGSCFGAADDGEENSFFKNKACATFSSVFVPNLSPSSDTSASEDDGMNMNNESIRRSLEYARYRE